MKFFLAIAVSLLFLFIATPTTRAITAIARDFDQLVTRADTVFKGTVTAKSSLWTGEGEQRHIVTFVTFHVEETYKGASAAEQTLRFLGGTVGDDTMEVPDLPKFETGQRAVLFVVNNGKQFCPLVGVAQGRFHVVHDDASGRDRVFTNEGLPVVDTAEIGQLDASGVPKLQRYAHTGTPALSSEDFKAAVLGKVAVLTR